MQHQAGLSIQVREKIAVMAKHVQKHCFSRTHKSVPLPILSLQLVEMTESRVPCTQAISKRYIKMFLGPKELNPSLVERADTMMESAARGERTQEGIEHSLDQVIQAVKYRYFAKR